MKGKSITKGDCSLNTRECALLVTVDNYLYCFSLHFLSFNFFLSVFVRFFLLLFFQFAATEKNKIEVEQKFFSIYVLRKDVYFLDKRSDSVSSIKVSSSRRFTALIRNGKQASNLHYLLFQNNSRKSMRFYQNEALR